MPYWEYMTHEWNDDYDDEYSGECYTYLHRMSKLGAQRWELVCTLPYTKAEIKDKEENHSIVHEDDGVKVSFHRVLMKREVFPLA